MNSLLNCTRVLSYVWALYGNSNQSHGSLCDAFAQSSFSPSFFHPGNHCLRPHDSTRQNEITVREALCGTGTYARFQTSPASQFNRIVSPHQHRCKWILGPSGLDFTPQNIFSTFSLPSSLCLTRTRKLIENHCPKKYHLLHLTNSLRKSCTETHLIHVNTQKSLKLIKRNKFLHTRIILSHHHSAIIKQTG